MKYSLGLNIKNSVILIQMKVGTTVWLAQNFGDSTTLSLNEQIVSLTGRALNHVKYSSLYVKHPDSKDQKKKKQKSFADFLWK